MRTASGPAIVGIQDQVRTGFIEPPILKREHLQLAIRLTSVRAYDLLPCVCLA
jgi:hypothetical protein